MNSTNKQRLMDMDNRLVVTRGLGVGKREDLDGAKRVKYIMREISLSMGGEHRMQYIYPLLLNCTPEAYWILLTNVVISNNLAKEMYIQAQER